MRGSAQRGKLSSHDRLTHPHAARADSTRNPHISTLDMHSQCACWASHRMRLPPTPLPSPPPVSCPCPCPCDRVHDPCEMLLVHFPIGCFPCQAVFHVRPFSMSGRFPCQAASHVRPLPMSGCFPCQAAFHVSPLPILGCFPCQAVWRFPF